MDEEYMTVLDAAERMKVSRQTVWRLIRDGRLTTYTSMRDQRERLVKRADVEALIKPRKQEER